MSVRSVNDCLVSSKLSIDHIKSDGGILGYPAALLLFCIVDAIGHHYNVGEGFTRLEVLTHSTFGLTLEPCQISDLKMWYRNPLLHNAVIAPGVLLTSETSGDPFDFSEAPVKIRVPRFYEVVVAAWANVDKTTFDPLKDTVGWKKYVEPPPATGPIWSALTVSGVP